MKIGLLREGKNPPDKRVVFSPKACKKILESFNNISIAAQPSEIRCFTDEEYRNVGVELIEDLSHCDVLMGVKEVPLNMLIDDKIFLFFSHTIKKQPYNQKLLQTIIEKKIQLIDYETLLDGNKKRIIGFGRYAGIVGCYNTFLAYGKKTRLYNLKLAHLLEDQEELNDQLSQVKLPPDFKIILTGSGRVSSGVVEILKKINLHQVSQEDFLSKKFQYPVYCQLNPIDYHCKKDNGPVDKNEFYSKPNLYKSSLLNFCNVADMLITGHYYAAGSPILLSKEEIAGDAFNIKVIGDISCDIKEPIASTIRPSTIEAPIYGYNPVSGLEDDYMKDGVIVVMAVDNLPCSLPKDASIDFGRVFIEKVLPDLINHGPITSQATITANGNLTSNFHYLKDYVG